MKQANIMLYKSFHKITRSYLEISPPNPEHLYIIHFRHAAKFNTERILQNVNLNKFKFQRHLKPGFPIKRGITVLKSFNEFKFRHWLQF